MAKKRQQNYLMMQKSQLMTEIILKNKENLEKQLKGVKNSAKTQAFNRKRQNII
jgi:hypothetical protein|tara:strand:- start:101 stop:262 length:162 start_codon:yes stop_codon:yes gene_type:complete